MAIDWKTYIHDSKSCPGHGVLISCVFSFFLYVGVIAVVIFTILCTLVFLIRYMFRHKGTYHTNEAKGAESAESADAAIMNNDPNFTETIDESKKEWLI
uniref:Neurexin/syndecan/glycophorin C domain-containing protein n=1 Tax=Falco tinnunculus TaxID=100819 RepID=A0A8C4UBQ7_FALTI